MNQGTLFVGPTFRRVEQGGQSSVWLGPRLVLSYVTNDRAEVRLAIATLRAWNLDGKGIAKLLGVAESSVSRMGSAIAAQGLAAAVVGGRMGRPTELTPGVIKRVVALKEAGFNHRSRVSRFRAGRRSTRAVTPARCSWAGCCRRWV